MPSGTAAPRTPARASAAARSRSSAGTAFAPRPRRRRGSRRPRARPGHLRKPSASGQRSGKRIRHVLERLSSFSDITSNSDEERHRAGGEDRVRPPSPRRQPAVGEHERDRQRPGEEDRPQRGDECRPRAAGERARMRLQRHPRVRRCAASTAASDSAPTTRIQPIGLRGRRATISAPTAAGAEIAAKRKGYSHTSRSRERPLRRRSRSSTSPPRSGRRPRAQGPRQSDAAQSARRHSR